MRNYAHVVANRSVVCSTASVWCINVSAPRKACPIDNKETINKAQGLTVSSQGGPDDLRLIVATVSTHRTTTDKEVPSHGV
jgi:hypothetical protein